MPNTPPKPPAKPATPAPAPARPATPAPAPARPAPAPAPAKAPTPAPAPARPAPTPATAPAKSTTTPAGIAVAPPKAATPAPAPAKSSPGGISIAQPAPKAATPAPVPAKAATPVFSLQPAPKASTPAVTAPKPGSAAAITASSTAAKTATTALAKAAVTSAATAAKTSPSGVSVLANAAPSAPVATPAGFAPAQVPSASQYMPSYAAPEANVTKAPTPNKEASNAMASAANVQSSGKASPAKAASLAKTAASTLATKKASGVRTASKATPPKAASKAIPTKVTPVTRMPVLPKAPVKTSPVKSASRSVPKSSALTKATANLARAAASVVKAQVADATQAPSTQLAAPARTKLRQMPARVVTPYVGASPRVFPDTTRQDETASGNLPPANTGAPAYQNAPITTADSGNYATHRMGYVESNQQSQQRIGPGFYSLSRLSNVPFVKIVGVARSEKVVTWGERFEIPAGENGRVVNASYHPGEIVLNGGKDVNLGPRRINVPFNLTLVDAMAGDNVYMPDTRVDTRGAKAVWAVVPVTAQPNPPLTFSPIKVYNFAVERANNTASNIGAPFEGSGSASQLLYVGGNSPSRIPLGYLCTQDDIREVTMSLLDTATFTIDLDEWVLYQPLNADSPTYFVIEY